MFVLVENDSITKTVPSNKGITIGENQYPRAIYTSWSPAEREAIGIYEVVYDNSNRKDGEYYTNTNQSLNFAGGKVTASYGSATAKELADVTNKDSTIDPGLKSQHKEKVKQQASSLLTLNDWYVIKATEVDSYSVPAEMTTYRAAVRTASNDMEALIDACSTVDELAALYVPVDETRPLGEFPEAV
jgi:hypothetical protein